MSSRTENTDAVKTKLAASGESAVADNRDAALEADRELFDIITAAEADYATLTTVMGTEGGCRPELSPESESETE
ncbi:hypothetical protein V3C10_09685 [[Clostridium] symbiosum]|uniref:hypothetical protein n=1 Tax=Clostridium symbiosum TaxID=1512 RepID=UPI001D06ADE8|nr:hypothetical protein [[Clostridium] symbiosum]MCB6607689.1 hypothetical protein [[Clostridium] symbiosum]MCB6929366.1 hypothetical protein [[Clostridium] symbiosum]